MSALAVEIADAVAELLGGFELEGWIIPAAERKFLPTLDPDGLEELTIVVVPRAVRISLASRGRDTHDYLVEIAIAQRVRSEEDGGDSSEAQPTGDDHIAALLELVEAATEFIRRKELSGPGAFWVPEPEQEKRDGTYQGLFDPKRLREHNVFFSVIRSRYRKLR